MSDLVETDIPARLDRLPWSRFHTLVVVALGITWIFDGLEVTLAGALSGALKDSPVLQFSNTDIGIVGSAYLAGAVLGALFFGWLTDRFGRKKLFFITVAVYRVATGATAFTWNLWTFALCRFFTGAGIGGLIGPPAMGVLVDGLGYRPSLVIAAALGVASFAVLLLLAPTPRPTAP